MQQVLQLTGGVAGFRSVDQDFARPQQRAVLREPHGAQRPQTEFVEVGNLIQCVVLAAVRVAGMVGQLGELAEHGQIGVGTERSFELRHRGDLPLEQQSAKPFGVYRC